MRGGYGYNACEVVPRSMESFHLLNHIRNREENTIVIWVFNIGTEKIWNEGSKAAIHDLQENMVVNHVEEINLLVTRKQDYLVLRKKPDSEFLERLAELGFEIPTILCPTFQNEEKTISELILEDQGLLQKLSEIGKREKVYFVPYGVSKLEEKIAKECNLQLIGGTHEKSCIVNNKIFSKQVAKELQLPYALDFVCDTAEELAEAYERLREKYSKIIVKMPCNSSGQGMWIIDSENRLKTVSRIIKRMSANPNNKEWLAEGWIDKKTDLNMQVYVSETGEVETFSVKEQIIEETLYIGSVFPARISAKQYEKCVEYGNEIGRYLFTNGFTGVFGIDALVDMQGDVIPIIEINGRFTLSTYLSFLQGKYADKHMYAFYRRMTADDELNFISLQACLQDAGLLFDGNEGVMIYNAATANAKMAEGHVRLFLVAIGNDAERAGDLSEECIRVIEQYRKN